MKLTPEQKLFVGRVVTRYAESRYRKRHGLIPTLRDLQHEQDCFMEAWETEQSVESPVEQTRRTSA